jgi:hypothetical protein
MKAFSKARFALAALSLVLALAGCGGPDGGGGPNGPGGMTLTLSGTVDVSVNGELPHAVRVVAHQDSSLNSETGSTLISNYEAGNDNWSITIWNPWFSTAYFQVLIQAVPGGSWIAKNPEVNVQIAGKTNINSIELVIDDISVQTISGTADVKVNGSRPYQVSVDIYKDSPYSGDSLGTVTVENYQNPNNNNWSISIEPLADGGTLYYRLGALYAEGTGWKNINTSSAKELPAGGGDVDGISLSGSTNLLILSGTVNVTVNGSKPNYATVYAYNNPDYSGNSPSYYINNYNSNTNWTLVLDPASIQATYYFRVSMGGNNFSISQNMTATVTVNPGEFTKSGINLSSSASTITLTGTINATANGNNPGSLIIYASKTGDPYSFDGYSNLYNYQGGTASWTMQVLSSPVPVTYYFRVYANNLNNMALATVTVNPGETTKNVDLGTINLVSTGTGYINTGGLKALEDMLTRNIQTYYYANLLSHSNNYHYFRVYYQTYNNNENIDSYIWIVDGAIELRDLTETSQYFYSKDYSVGTHYVTLLVIKNNIMTSREFTFTVVD